MRRSTFSKPLKSSKPIGIPNVNVNASHHRITNLPDEFREVVDYVPVARSLTDQAVPSLRQPKLHIEQELPVVEWQPDDASKTCMHCHLPFIKMWRNRHHCRVCGQLVCASCSSMVACGFAHRVQNQLLVTSLDADVNSRCETHRVCFACKPRLARLDHALGIARILAIVLGCMKENVFLFFGNLASVSKRYYIASHRLKKLFIASQYVYGNPWNLAHMSRSSYKYHMTRCLLRAMAPHIQTHAYYVYALHYYNIAKVSASTLRPTKCKLLRCRHDDCTKNTTSSVSATQEINMTRLFYQNQSQVVQWTFELAVVLTPTLLWKERVDVIIQLIQRFKAPYMAKLFVWLHAFPFGVGYVDRFRHIIPKTTWQDLTASWEFFHDLCEVARTCKHNLKDMRFQALAQRLATNPVDLVGYTNLQIISLDVANMSQANSYSKPFMLPCKVYNKHTKQYSKECLLVKYCQSLGSDGFVHLWIEYMKSLVPDPSVLVTYPTIPIGSYAGIILMVNHSLTLSSLTKKSTLQNKLYDLPANKHMSRNCINTRFAKSTAFFIVLTCFIGLRDRIESNMMILPKAQVLFHIDFEYMFNKQPPMKETIREMGTFMEKFMHKKARSAKSSKSSTSLSSSSHFLEMQNDMIVMKPLLPDSVMSMLGDHDSNTYTLAFKPAFNHFFQMFWDQRHALYFASKFLVFFPSTTKASQLSRMEHDAFFSDLANIVLNGSDTYGEFAGKVMLNTNPKKPWTERLLNNMSKWSRQSQGT